MKIYSYPWLMPQVLKHVNLTQPLCFCFMNISSVFGLTACLLDDSEWECLLFLLDSLHIRSQIIAKAQARRGRMARTSGHFLWGRKEMGNQWDCYSCTYLHSWCLVWFRKWEINGIAIPALISIPGVWMLYKLILTVAKS